MIFLEMQLQIKIGLLSFIGFFWVPFGSFSSAVGQKKTTSNLSSFKVVSSVIFKGSVERDDLNLYSGDAFFSFVPFTTPVLAQNHYSGKQIHSNFAPSCKVLFCIIAYYCNVKMYLCKRQAESVKWYQKYKTISDRTEILNYDIDTTFVQMLYCH